MKKSAKRALAFILSIIFVFSSFTAVTAQSSTVGSDIPVIYVHGQGCSLIADEPEGTRPVYPISLPADYIESAVKNNIGVFAKAVITQEWDEFCDVLYDIVAPLYKEIALDENGESRNGIRAAWSWDKNSLNTTKVNGKYPIERFDFQYDFRLDPYETADILHQYIEDVLEATGEEKVALSGRCLGACIAAAYMEKYDGEYVSDLILYASALNGVAAVGKSFSGELYLDADSVERYVYDLDIAADKALDDLIDSFVSLFNATYGLDVACWSVNNVFPDIYLKIIPRLLIDTFGTFPGYWAMVSDEDYEKAKETVFYGSDTEKYAKFIEKIDNYHYNVQNEIEKDFRHYNEIGIETANIVKYGYQSVPIEKGTDKLSDGLCYVSDSSIGANTVSINKKFNRFYLKKAKDKGTDIYISPDCEIDASKCLMPDRTWFVKNLEHKNFPKCMDELYSEIINNNGFTVFSDEKYPQYLVYNKASDGAESIAPMLYENKLTDEKYNVSFFTALGNFYKSLFRIIINSIRNNSVSE